MVEGISIRSKKEISILFFYNIFMLYWSSRVKSVLILNIAYFSHPLFEKMSTYLDEANETVKS